MTSPTSNPSGPTLSGPVVEPASGGPARQLVVFLHGVGADGNDLISLAEFFAEALPDAAFVSPDGPAPYDMAPFGRQWFSLQDRSGEAIAAGVRAAAPAVERFLEEQLAERGLGDEQLALVGFSQGTMMSLHVAPRRARACAAVVGFSGALVDAPSLADEVRARPRMLLIHGDADPVVNPQCLPAAEAALAAVGIPVLTEMRPEVEHTIDGYGAALAREFLRQVFTQTPVTEA